MEKATFKVLLCFLLIVTLVLGDRDAANIERSMMDIYKSNRCGVGRECVPRSLCDQSGGVIRDGRNLISLRSLFEVNDECKWNEVCCSVNNKKPNNIKPPQRTCNQQCGRSNPNGLDVTLTNTQDVAQIGEFPWVVQVLEFICDEEDCKPHPVGGGSLLTFNVVLTTAHTIANSSAGDLSVRAGEWDTQSTKEPYGHSDREVKDMQIHELFDAQTAVYDIALLKLKTPFMRAPNVGTVCLPETPRNIDQENCFVMGWGTKSDRDQFYPSILKKIRLSVVDSRKCESLLWKTRLGRYFELHDSFICAGGEKDKDACYGDGGSPLVCPLRGSSDRFQLVGLVSWGLGCGVKNVPGVYTNVQLLRPWIEQHLRN